MKRDALNKIVLTLLLFSGSQLFARQAATFPIKIDTVIVIGNEHTKSQVILREIPFKFPTSLAKQDFLTIQNRIQNLFLFNRVELNLSQFQDKTALIVVVSESWYFFPIPLLFINERDWGKLSYGLQLTHMNFRGMNEKLSIGGWLGYDPSFFISYLNPWMGRHKKLILGFSAFHNRIRNKIFSFQEKRTGIKLMLGKKITLKFKSEFEFQLQRVSLPEDFRTFSSSHTGTDVVPALSYHIRYDARDLFEYPKKGFFVDYLVQRTGFTSRQPRYWQFTFDNRLYHPIAGKISAAFRNLLIVNSGHLPIYNRVFLGYRERIRGYFSRVFPAPALYQHFSSPEISLTSFEIRFPIIPIHYFSYKGLPLLSMFSRDLKLGLSAGFFIDSGIVWQTKSEFTLNNFYTGYGAGLHIHLPYINVLRLDYAWNDQGAGEFILDAGIAF